MSNILIVGNGFDIYHKLPTRYTDFLFLVQHWDDFFQAYKEIQESEMTSGKCEQFDVRVDDNGKLTVEALDDYTQHAYCLKFDRIKQLDEIIRKNLWIKYFIETSYNKDGWIDFEAEIERFLVNIEEFFSITATQYADKSLREVLGSDCYDIVRFLMNNTKVLPSNEEVYYNISYSQILQGSVKKTLLNVLLDSLNELIEALSIYMEEFVANIKIRLFSKQIRTLPDLNLLSFNYTCTYKTVYGGTKLKHTHQIHGSLQEKDIVLGISDDQFDNLEYIYFQKYFQRIQKRTGTFYQEWISKKASSLNDELVDVYIMGHSLGRTDKGILDDFFLNEDWVRQITIYYHEQKAYEDLVIALITLYGKKRVIKWTGDNRVIFKKLEPPVFGTGKRKLN